MRPDGKITLAVTGGIGSGKSAVCSVFRKYGVPVYDSDSRTKALYDRDMINRISRALHEDFMSPDGSVDRKRLASAVFSDPDKLSVLEGIVHPEVKKDFLSWLDGVEGPLAVMESAIILEKPYFHDIADRILLVDAPLDLRMERAAGRDHVDVAVIRNRMASQELLNRISEGSLHVPVDYVIMNTGAIKELEDKVKNIYEDLTGEKLI